MNKLILKYEPDLDFILIAITAPLKDYRFCFKLNKELRIQFSRIDDLELQFGSGPEIQFFSRYYYQEPQTEVEFYLIANKGNEGWLIPEMKGTDYFILIRNYIDDEDREKFLGSVNKLNEVVSAVEVNPRKLKSKENLIF
ncbi:IPExxxVDY family protein [Pedobacter sp. HMF7647]|uniref:IPExxxVDY family protein n=1 Tax=Hufsiella arboris TaxID=2695275 RepID=A0A7K1Y658_9SPHI|nr:IPExxxVDY family protein [Hufsiella arboris]MXV50064.1 IPExxxVDY family protein [Hufsiella arboris]